MLTLAWESVGFCGKRSRPGPLAQNDILFEISLCLRKKDCHSAVLFSYDSIMRSLFSSRPEAVLNSTSRSGTVSFSSDSP